MRTLQTTTQPPVDGPFTIPANATTAQVIELLASFRSEVESASQSKSKRRELAACEHLGMRAFEWMKQLEALDQQLAISKDFCADLSWLLLAEGEESTLVEFLLSEAESFKHLPQRKFQKLYHDEGVTGYRLRRNLQLLGRLLDAHGSLSKDGTANDALRCLSAFHNTAKEKGVVYAVNWAGASNSLRRLLANSHCPPCDERLLAGLYEVMRHSTKPKYHQRELALFKLYHPTSPDPFIAPEAIKKELHKRYAWKAGHRAVTRLGVALLRTMLILNLRGATSEAKRARDTLQTEFAHVWNGRRRIIGDLERDPKLQQFPGLRAAARAMKYDDDYSVSGDLPAPREEVITEFLMAKKYVR